MSSYWLSIQIYNMKLRFVYGILPAFVFYPIKEVPPATASSRGPFVSIYELQEEEGVLQHELVHVRQWYRTFGMHPILYHIFRKYRQNSEVEAFRKQLRYTPHKIDIYVGLLTCEYDLYITDTKARELLLA